MTRFGLINIPFFGYFFPIFGGRPKPCDPSRHLQESPDPPGPKSQKSQKGLFGCPQKSLKKIPGKSLKTPIFRPFWVFLDFFGYFLGLFCRPAERPFWRLFCDFGPGGSGDSCKWRLGSQPKPTFSQSFPISGWRPDNPFLGDRDRGGQNVPNARGGGNSPRKLPLENLDF